MKYKHTTRKERRDLRRAVESRIQDLVTQQAPRRAALALLNLHQASRLQASLIQKMQEHKGGRP